MTDIAVVGGSGFIGTRLCRRLAASDTLFSILDKAPSDAYPSVTNVVDVRSVKQLRRAVPEGAALINLAAEHRDDVRPRSLYEEVNVEGARNLCAVAIEKGVTKIVFTSSVAVYGFAPADTDESGAINPFNDYGRTKAEAENVYRAWQADDPANRALIIIRPTVVFGENNRGNVYNLLRQIASGRFVMIGHGRNRKSMAYVENVAAFIEYSLGFAPGAHVYNYVDKPDLDMNRLVSSVRAMLGRSKGNRVGMRLPYALGYAGGLLCDAVARTTNKSLPISSIRVKKFCATTQFETTIKRTGFVPPVSLEQGLNDTVRHEFLEDHSEERVFFTE